MEYLRRYLTVYFFFAILGYSSPEMPHNAIPVSDNDTPIQPNLDENEEVVNEIVRNPEVVTEGLDPDQGDNDVLEWTEEDEIRWRKERIRNYILQQLGNAAPSNRTYPPLPEPLRDTEPDFQNDGAPKDEDPFPIKQIITFGKQTRHHCRKQRACIHFDMENGIGFVKSAEIWVRKNPRIGTSMNHTYRISQYSRYKSPHVLAETNVTGNDDWVKFESDGIKDILMQWKTRYDQQRRSLHSHGLIGYVLVECTTCVDKTTHPIQFAGENRPFIITNLERPKFRYLRSVASEGECTMKPMTYNFQEEGISMIVQPAEYSPNYCDGSCRVDEHPGILQIAANEHVRTIMQTRKFKSLGKTPCCAPSKMGSMMILYYNNDGRMIRQEIKNMVVEACGCY